MQPFDTSHTHPAQRDNLPATTPNVPATIPGGPPPAESAWILLAVPNTPPHPVKWMVGQLAADEIQWSRDPADPNLWVRMTARLRRDRRGLDYAQFVTLKEAIEFLEATRGQR